MESAICIPPPALKGDSTTELGASPGTPGGQAGLPPTPGKGKVCSPGLRCSPHWSSPGHLRARHCYANEGASHWLGCDSRGDGLKPGGESGQPGGSRNEEAPRAPPGWARGCAQGSLTRAPGAPAASAKCPPRPRTPPPSRPSS